MVLAGEPRLILMLRVLHVDSYQVLQLRPRVDCAYLAPQRLHPRTPFPASASVRQIALTVPSAARVNRDSAWCSACSRDRHRILGSQSDKDCAPPRAAHGPSFSTPHNVLHAPPARHLVLESNSARVLIGHLSCCDTNVNCAHLAPQRLHRHLPFAHQPRFGMLFRTRHALATRHFSKRLRIMHKATALPHI